MPNVDASTTNKKDTSGNDVFIGFEDTIIDFPNFELLEERHRAHFESITTQFQPYSAFNFTNLRAWDIHNNRKVCLLNGNLILLLSDYRSGEPFLTILGKNDISNSLTILLDYAEREKIDQNIRFVTQEAVQSIEQAEFHIIEDRPNFDYIYSTDQLVELRGSLFKEKRQLVQRFKREHPEVTVVFLNITEDAAKKQAMELLSQWEQNKQDDEKQYTIEHEIIALNRIFNDDIGKRVFMTALFDRSTMIGFGIDEILSDHHSVSHFAKANIRYKGVYEFLNEQIARHLVKNDVKWWNWQQDLGIEGLRKVKLSYHPIHFLKKYTVSRK